jgi:hypothetical protein
MSAQATQPSLYERLGGIYSIATVVDDFIDRVMTDPRLNANPQSTKLTTRSCRRASSIWSPKWSAGRAADRRSIPDARCVSLTST